MTASFDFDVVTGPSLQRRDRPAQAGGEASAAQHADTAPPQTKDNKETDRIAPAALTR
jgi:hypothetical protein